MANLCVMYVYFPDVYNTVYWCSFSRQFLFFMNSTFFNKVLLFICFLFSSFFVCANMLFDLKRYVSIFIHIALLFNVQQNHISSNAKRKKKHKKTNEKPYGNSKRNLKQTVEFHKKIPISISTSSLAIISPPNFNYSQNKISWRNKHVLTEPTEIVREPESTTTTHKNIYAMTLFQFFFLARSALSA